MANYGVDIMTENQFSIIGYHGTFSENVNRIIKKGYTFERKDNHWLGQGIYFYDKINLAKWFAERKSKKNYNKEISVIESFMCTGKEKVLNLDTNEGVDYLYSKIKERLHDIGKIVLSNDKTINRCIILDIIKEYYEIDIIIKTFETKTQTYGRANINWFEENMFMMGIYYSEKQICVTNNECIKNSKLVEEKQNYCYGSKLRF